jgi:hypothetical protein
MIHHFPTVGLALTAMFAAGTAAGIEGLIMGGLMNAVVIFSAQGLTARARWRRAIIGIAGGLALLAILWGPSVSGMSQRGRVAWCNENLKSIGVALLNYHQTWGRFPPAYLSEDAGQRAHSWRVLVLPFVDRARFSFDHQAVFARYDCEVPWHSPNNAELMRFTLHDREVLSAVRLYQCPSRPRVDTRGELTTHYFAITGQNTAWPSDESRSLDDIAIPEETLLVVECFDRAVPWLEPSDVALNEAAVAPRIPVGLGNWWLGLTLGSRISFYFFEEKDAGLQYHGYIGRHALFADGSVRPLPHDLSAADFKALADIRDVPKPMLPPPPSDGEAVPDMIRRLPFPPVAIRWAGLILFLAALPAMACSARLITASASRKRLSTLDIRLHEEVHKGFTG